MQHRSSQHGALRSLPQRQDELPKPQVDHVPGRQEQRGFGPTSVLTIPTDLKAPAVRVLYCRGPGMVALPRPGDVCGDVREGAKACMRYQYRIKLDR